MQGHSAEIMPFQRCDKRADIALAIAEYHCILDVFTAQQAAQGLALALW